MIKSIFSYCKEWASNIWQAGKLRFKSSVEKDLEILALKSQLALYTNQTKLKKRRKPKSTLAFRQLWVLISMLSSKWESFLAIFKPATVVKWHREAFKLYWKNNSKKIGRPPISKEVIAIIKRIHKENPLLSPEKINEQLALMGLKNPPSPNTICKYLPTTKKPPSDRQIQSWKTFIKNHMDVTWATDFLTIPTLKFDILYILIIIDHGTRKIVHHAVTKNPNMFWLKQQFRNATPYGNQPKYLIHDNDPVFKSKVFQGFLSDANIKSKPTTFRSPWQNPYAERVNGIIRQELLNLIIPLGEKHLEKLLSEYVNYYNNNRTHQGIDCKTPIPKPSFIPSKAKDFKIKSNPVLNGLYHSYERVA